jgi:pimeloyl-ACP methyl ester carboxylesterase
LKGAEGAPAVILLHRYGADRSFMFNLGVKINETTNFTILWPDLRGHGMSPPVKRTSFGTREGEDLLAALDFLRNAKSDAKKKLVGDRFGVYGVELGAYAALKAARADSQIKVLVLDSIQREPNELLRDSVTKCLGVDIGPVQSLRVWQHGFLISAITTTRLPVSLPQRCANSTCCCYQALMQVI